MPLSTCWEIFRRRTMPSCAVGAEWGCRCAAPLDSQALLQLRNEYCTQGRCTDCKVGKKYNKKSGTRRSVSDKIGIFTGSTGNMRQQWTYYRK